ncbi:MAG: NUDIX domain-containing protein [Akkermansiaceae bacterium]|nr:NUDIX domain-containing protein [Armatimonadota bacterium]
MGSETAVPRQHRHLGVYGVCILDERVLLIRKARGPYTGLLDLPGGGIEFAEEPEMALQREFREETGLTISNPSIRQAASKLVRHEAEDGVEEELHHVGLIYDVSVSRGSKDTLPEPDRFPDGQDSLGASWVRLSDVDEIALTPFARLALAGGTRVSSGW